LDKPFEQNIIAIIWDFDKTLINGYMQEPIFRRYGISGNDFWQEVNGLNKKYADMGVLVNKDTIYLNHILTCVEQGIFEGLNNQTLLDLGGELTFYDGIPDIFESLNNSIKSNTDFQKHKIDIEHYVVSTGLAQMIRGSQIAQYVQEIWGCEFIEDPIKSSLNIKEYSLKDKNETRKSISQIGYTIDNTSKTRAIFEINKGSNKYKEIDVNSHIDWHVRRIPFENMIYIADGPSDVPVFSILQQYHGSTYAVYPKGNKSAFRQVDQLRKDKRIDAFGEADYSKDTTTSMWLHEHVNQIGSSICRIKEAAIRGSISKPPKHING
jgi:hypothetical protein